MSRVDIKKTSPLSYAAMSALERYMKQSSIPPKYKEIVKIRASIINGCAYCIDMHTHDARKLGESERRIYAIAAWHESPLFTDEERALLEFTDEVTKISEHGVSDEVYIKISAHFSELQIAEIIMQIITTNAWNRIAVSTQMIYDPDKDNRGKE